MPDLIDLRSDTVTRPTPAMRAAIAAAEVGDDIFGDDPTINRLQDVVADLLGKEAALFMPTGSMSNQTAIKTHTRPGDELICDANAHIVHYETGGPAALSGVMCRTIEAEGGLIELAQLEGVPRGLNDHNPHTTLLCLENTHNRGGGRIYPIERVEAIGAWARRQGLARHLDGARLMNAVVATGVPARRWADCFDTVSICFSKGLGAPVGSALAGPADFIKRARRNRKMLGGGLRQSGVLAAAALYALEHHVERLAEDHRHARLLAETAAQLPGLSLWPDVIETNILYLKLEPRFGNAADFVHRLKVMGVLALPTGPYTVRLVTHLDVSREKAETAAQVIADAARERAG
ncbi:MAG TPA: low-specificity L-threonine aldolase [Gemmatales bacterium]|nr:low-specificity L-threonine aldolase [Gemmatales bacterium]HMP60727.1 low-specificity L-threonine aldolase [Gemmatales bacterium]